MSGDGATVEVDGGRELAAALHGVEAGLKDLSGTNAKVANAVAPVARRLAPRLTGALQGSIHGEGSPTSAEVGTPIAYGWPVHSGVPARNIAGVPFITEAWTRTEPVWTAIYKDDVQTLVDTQVATKANH